MNIISSHSMKTLQDELNSAREKVILLEKKVRTLEGIDSEGPSRDAQFSISDHYKLLLEDIDQGVVVLDGNHETVFANEGILRVLGCERPELDGRGFFNFLSDIWQDRAEYILSELSLPGAQERIDSGFLFSTGKPVAVKLRVVPVRNKEDAFEGIHFFVTDVTDQRRVKEALIRSEKMYQALFNGAGDAIFVHNSEGKLINCNDIACSRLDYSREELLRCNYSDIAFNCFGDGGSLGRENKGFSGVVRELYRTRAGELFPVETSSREVALNGENKILTIARDISERVEADNKASLHRKRLKALYEMAHMNERSIPAFFEFAIRSSLELSESEFGFIAQLQGSGSNISFSNWISMDQYGISGVIPEPDDKSVLGRWAETIVHRSPVYVNNLSPDADLFPLNAKDVRSYLALPVLDGNGVAAIAVLANRDKGYEEDNVRNLTLLMDGMWSFVCKRKSEEQVKRSLREKETLLKEVHHRVKNNMQVICSLLNLQTDYIKDPQDLTLIRHSIDRVRSMSYVHEQLYRSDDLSRIDFSDYIAGLGRSLISTYGVAGRISFSTNLAPIKLTIEQALPCGLIVNELITNAINHAFTDFDEPDVNKIRVELACMDEKVRIMVADNGIGLEHGLERTGSLGHVLVETLVQQIYGKMEITSDNGACFELVFDLK